MERGTYLILEDYEKYPHHLLMQEDLVFRRHGDKSLTIEKNRYIINGIDNKKGKKANG